MSRTRRVPTAEGKAEVREKGSVFLSFLLPAGSREEAEARLAELKRRFADATHHCWAWRLGEEERSSDDGEPAGTAGMPILQVLRGAELWDALCVVVRWFGGTKLGKGGLARAYALAAREALAGCVPVEQRVRRELHLTLDYPRIGAVKRLLRPPEIELVTEAYGAQVELTLLVAEDRREELLAALADLSLMPDA